MLLLSAINCALRVHLRYFNTLFLRAFVKIAKKATIMFVVSVHLTVRLHETPRSSLDGLR